MRKSGWRSFSITLASCNCNQRRIWSSQTSAKEIWKYCCNNWIQIVEWQNPPRVTPFTVNHHPLTKSSDLEVGCFRTPNEQNGIKNNAMMALWTSQICHCSNQIFCAEAAGAAEKIAKYCRQKQYIYTNLTKSDLTKDAGKNLHFVLANSIIRQKNEEIIYSATSQLFQPPKTVKLTPGESNRTTWSWITLTTIDVRENMFDYSMKKFDMSSKK